MTFAMFSTIPACQATQQFVLRRTGALLTSEVSSPGTASSSVLMVWVRVGRFCSAAAIVVSCVYSVVKVLSEEVLLGNMRE